MGIKWKWKQDNILTSARDTVTMTMTQWVLLSYFTKWQILFPLFLLVRCKQGHMHKVWSVCLCLHASRRKFQLKTLNINIYKYYIIYFTHMTYLLSFFCNRVSEWVSYSLLLLLLCFCNSSNTQTKCRAAMEEK